MWSADVALLAAGYALSDIEPPDGFHAVCTEGGRLAFVTPLDTLDASVRARLTARALRWLADPRHARPDGPPPRIDVIRAAGGRWRVERDAWPIG
ncbi:YraN family protein [Bifidobacterium myosotis]|uniref:Uncharacterized protein n=1 Tax=Bifidobacterium myosotis TaxID=1630166 RepID=A0A5M9ZGB4_9BIFI|nr:YraN family protein [Bifidobacterium myosotis]KAA8825379.1 hypothetical protein EMO91_12505 [Bifidobacterium myosotis]